MNLDLSNIPDHMHEGIRGYVDHGISPGSFLRAVLCNDLMSAANNADSINRRYLFEYAALLYNELPRVCWGDSSKVDTWISKKGMEQYEQEKNNG